MEKKKIYLAGFECFLKNSRELAEEAVMLCSEYGFEGISPVIGDGTGEETDFSHGRKEAAKTIFRNNIRYIDHCDIVVANLNNFRGWEPDSGTCFEMGYAYTKGKLLYGFMDDTRPCYEKYIGSIHYDRPYYRDDNGAFFESGACNLMLSGMSEIVKGNLEDALKKLSEDLGKGDNDVH